MESEEKDIKKIDIIDNETKSVLGDLLDVTTDIKKLIIKEIKSKKKIVEHFDQSKHEYIEAIDNLSELEKLDIEEEKQNYFEALKKLKEKLNG